MKWLILAPALFVVLVVGITVYLQPNSMADCGTTPSDAPGCGAADAIVVVSGGDTNARTTRGIELYKSGWANTLVFSGAAQDQEGPSNAAAMQQIALEAGVPEAAILLDEDARNTQQNASNVTSLFKENDLHDIIVVTSGYHERRAMLEFEKRAEGGMIRSAPVTEDKDWSWYWWATPRGWWLAGSELVKIVGFYIGATD